MKVCPKCRSTYADETLNFCLTDGAPLVGEESASGNLSSANSWQNAETVRDSRFHFSENSHRTAPMIDAPTENLSRPQTSKTKLYPILGGLMLLGGGFRWFAPNKNPAADLSESERSKIKKEIVDFIESWRESNEERDIDGHIDH